jgi:SAM-dependent methyltransferase
MSDQADMAAVKAYFARCIVEHGDSPRGVDWNSVASQELRFEQLLRVVKGAAPFSILDYGSGYGALADYIEKQGLVADYFGYDIVEEAVTLARKTHAASKNRTFFMEGEALPQADYVVASGIFNVRGQTNFEDWTKYVLETLTRFDQLSTKGFASNFLTKYSDADRMRADLYYADPLFLFDYAKRHFSRNVALLHDYEIYDFTLVVRKGG